MTETKQQRNARLILEAIRRSPENFDMGYWCESREVSTWSISETSTPPCGTTMCIAGWGAFLDGWTMKGVAEVEKDGASQEAIYVGRRFLDISPLDPLPFYETNETAIRILERMASGEPYSKEMLYDERIRDLSDERDED